MQHLAILLCYHLRTISSTRALVTFLLKGSLFNITVVFLIFVVTFFFAWAGRAQLLGSEPIRQISASAEKFAVIDLLPISTYCELVTEANTKDHQKIQFTLANFLSNSNSMSEFFTGCPLEFLTSISTDFVAGTYIKGEILIQEGTAGDEVYITSLYIAPFLCVTFF